MRVQTLCPGFTHTEFQQRAGIDVSKIPTFAWMTPEAVVEASRWRRYGGGRSSGMCPVYSIAFWRLLIGAAAAGPGAPCIEASWRAVSWGI